MSWYGKIVYADGSKSTIIGSYSDKVSTLEEIWELLRKHLGSRVNQALWPAVKNPQTDFMWYKSVIGGQDGYIVNVRRTTVWVHHIVCPSPVHKPFPKEPYEVITLEIWESDTAY